MLILLLTIFPFALLYLSQKKKKKIKSNHMASELHQEVIASNAAASLIKELTNILISGARC